MADESLQANTNRRSPSHAAPSTQPAVRSFRSQTSTRSAGQFPNRRRDRPTRRVVSSSLHAGNLCPCRPRSIECAARRTTGMVRIVVTPTWAKLIELEETLPCAVEELIRQRAERQGG